MWVKPLNIQSPEFGMFSHKYPDLIKDEEKYHVFFMNIEQFYRLPQMAGEKIV
jgi:hypothetical protein